MQRSIVSHFLQKHLPQRRSMASVNFHILKAYHSQRNVDGMWPTQRCVGGGVLC
jgi:hypothetical protein